MWANDPEMARKWEKEEADEPDKTEDLSEKRILRLTMKELRNTIQEAIKLDIKKGDVILTGKFKNKHTVVKDIGTDENGHPTINGKSILRFKIEKLLPKKKWSKKSREQSKK